MHITLPYINIGNDNIMNIDFKNKKWLYPGIGIKRWVLLLIFSLLLISVGFSILLGYLLIAYAIDRLFFLLC